MEPQPQEPRGQLPLAPRGSFGWAAGWVPPRLPGKGSWQEVDAHLACPFACQQAIKEHSKPFSKRLMPHGPCVATGTATCFGAAFTSRAGGAFSPGSSSPKRLHLKAQLGLGPKILLRCKTASSSVMSILQKGPQPI